MPKKYNQDFKQMMSELHASGKTAAELSRDYGVSAITLGKWFAESNEESLKNYSSEEIAAMRAELLKAQQENEILKKALGIFAKPNK